MIYDSFTTEPTTTTTTEEVEVKSKQLSSASGEKPMSCGSTLFFF